MQDAFGVDLQPGDEIVTHIREGLGDSRRLVKAVVRGTTPTGLLQVELVKKKDRGFRSRSRLVRAEDEVMATGVSYPAAKRAGDVRADGAQ